MRWMGCLANVAQNPETEPLSEVICASDSVSDDDDEAEGDADEDDEASRSAIRVFGYLSSP